MEKNIKKCRLAICNIVGILLAAGPVNPAAAAYLATAYHVGALTYTCQGKGEGSGSIDQSADGCADYITSGSFMAFGAGQASYDTLKATARLGLDELDPSIPIGSGVGLATATGGATYNDSLTINIPGREGNVVDLEFTTTLHGALSAIGVYPDVYGVAKASLDVVVNGERLVVLRDVRNYGDPITSDVTTGRVQITLGTPFTVNASLGAYADISRGISPPPAPQYYSGDVISDLSSSAGITGFTLFESGKDGALIPEWSLNSQSGEFGFYSPVPLPATVWLFGSGLLGLVGMTRRKKS